ncbi:adventurous gliding motility protein GltJ [Myxococcus sp. Y35]|uniref:adventurous gliding motility protein GltJ n=1 Tax=Pseudomyxococcus flavus TaxID=3115648 RepID=UPI003CF5AF75
MRFVCDSCRAQYMISDDKIGPKGVKVRCKKCGHTITVRPAGAPAAKDSASESSPSETSATSEASKGSDAAAATMPATLGTPPEGGLFTDVEEDEIGAVFDQVLSSGTHKIPTEAANEAAAREASAENVRKLAEAEAEPDKEEAKPNAAAHEWYVAIDEKQVGPFGVEKVKDLWDRGEVGPDSLCWRSGFSDWIPLSEATDLASVLAPRPSKPVIVAPEPVSGSTPTVSAGPVQSAFSAGKGAQAGAAAASSEEPVGWKPSAASVLASLVKEENEALSKPPPTPAPALGKEPVSQSRLLDVPMPPPEPVSSPSLRGAEVPMAPAMAAPMPYGQPPAPQYAQPAPMPYGQPPAPQYAQPAPMPYPPQPSYPVAYPPPGAGQGGGKSKTGLFAGIAAGLLVVGGGAAALFLKGGSGTEAAPASPPVVASAPAAAPTPPPAAPPPANTAPAATAQAPTSPATPPATEGAAAPANTAAAPATPPPETAPTAVAAAPTPPPAAEPAKPAETAVAKVERPSSSRRTSSSSRREDPEPRSASARAERPSSSDSDDDFDELFGTKKSSSTSKPTASRPTAYVPPEPGGGTPDRLQQSDIMAVVLANKPAIVKCVNEQKKKDPSLSGKLVMRWTIQTSGKTTGISCRTDEFRSTYMASCISGLIKSWTFPRHKRQGEPIDFPFTF